MALSLSHTKHIYNTIITVNIHNTLLCAHLLGPTTLSERGEIVFSRYIRRVFLLLLVSAVVRFHSLLSAIHAIKIVKCLLSFIVLLQNGAMDEWVTSQQHFIEVINIGFAEGQKVLLNNWFYYSN